MPRYYDIINLHKSVILWFTGTVQKLKEEMEKEKERAVLQKKIGSLIKKEVSSPILSFGVYTINHIFILLTLPSIPGSVGSASIAEHRWCQDVCEGSGRNRRQDPAQAQVCRGKSRLSTQKRGEEFKTRRRCRLVSHLKYCQ